MTEPPPKLNVLVVDDDPADVLIVRRYLERARPGGFAVHSIGDLSRLPEILDEAPIDVILLDLNLPDSVGIDTLAAARVTAPTLPILVFTGLEDGALGIEAVSRGAQDYLVKGEVESESLARSLYFAVERARHLRDAEYAAFHDDLTGLANRALFGDHLENALQRRDRNGRRLAVLFFDLDGFKPINDRHGHLVGDEVLRSVARRLQCETRGADTVARLGGDEFCCLLEDVEDADSALETAERLRAALSGAYRVRGPDGPLQVTLDASVGVAICPDHGRTAEALLAAADAAMYAAKRRGGGGTRLHTSA